MYKIRLIDMPFAALGTPSIALTQLKHVIQTELEHEVDIDLIYVKNDFGQYLGMDQYHEFDYMANMRLTGIGDWLFRQTAFPEVTDNPIEYFKRYYPQHDVDSMKYKRYIMEKRKSLPAFLDSVIDKYDLLSTDLVGFTSFFSQNVASFAMAKRIKNRNHDVTTIMGGANCESPMGQAIIRNVQAMDFVFSGPSMISLTKFISCRMRGSMDECHAIDGVFSRENVDRVQSGHSLITLTASKEEKSIAPMGVERDIDLRIPLDYEAFFRQYNDSFGELTNAYIPFETSRGCWWGERSHCTFCGLNGSTMSYRAMSAGNAIEHIRSLFRYSEVAPRVELNCVDNILPTTYLKEVLPNIGPPENISIFYEIKANMSDDQVATMAKAKVTRVQPGIESLSTSVLKLMRKGSTAFTNISLLKSCLVHGVLPVWNLLIGFPGEDPTVYPKYDKDLPLLVHLPPPGGAYVVRFDRFSPYFVRAKEYELDLHPLGYYTLTYPFDEEAVANLAYYFYDNNAKSSNTGHLVWHESMTKFVETWKAPWQTGSPPQLKYVANDDTTVICDTRFADAREHVLSEAAGNILASLNKPMLMTSLVEHHASVYSRDTVENEVSFIRDRGLLFEEDNRMISLVTN